LLLASFLRFWRLGSLPPGLQHDEAYNGLDALALLDGQTFPIFHEGWELYAQQVHESGPVFQSQRPLFLEGNFGREPMVAYLMAPAIFIGGATPLALRSVIALAGTLAVLTTYGAAWELTQRRQRTARGGLVDIIRSLAPLLAAFIVAAFFPALVLSRYGVRAMLFVPLEGLVVFLFWRGVRKAAEHERAGGQASSAANILGLAMSAPGWFGAAGVLLGLSLYSYGAARFFPLLFATFVPLWLWRNRSARRRHLGDAALMAGAALLIAAPLLLYMTRHPYYAIYRSRVLANRGAGTYPGRPWITWARNLWRVFASLFWRGDSNLLHNLPGRPFLDGGQALLGAAGVAAIVSRRLSWRRLFLLLWLLDMAAPSIFTGDAPHFARLVGLITPLAILIAKGGTWLVEVIAARTEKAGDRPAMAAVTVLMTLLLLSSALAIRDYFVRYAGQSGLAELFSVDDWQLGRYAAALPKGEIIYLSPTQEKMATIYYALEGDHGRLRSYYSPNGTLIPAGNEGQSAYYLLRPRAAQAVDLLARRFPQGSIDLSQPGFTAFLLPARVARFQTGGEPLTWGGAIQLHEWGAEQAAGRLIVTMVWQAKVKMERSYTAYVHLLSQDGQLVAQKDRLPDGYLTSDWQPGEIVIDSYAIELPQDRQPGTYYLQTGFYYLPTQERLGEPAIFGEVALQR
jgi:4-amino-4-deoxy-L-arabinose transferase-like glycosyltransferase